jgi:hypothetical protein
LLASVSVQPTTKYVQASLLWAWAALSKEAAVGSRQPVCRDAGWLPHVPAQLHKSSKVAAGL